MGDIRYYNFHNLISLKIVKDHQKTFFEDLNFPFSHYQVDFKIQKPDITLIIGQFKPMNGDCYVVDHKFYIKKNYFYCKDQGGIGKWEIEISGIESGDTVVRFFGKNYGPESILYPDLLVQDMIIRQLIEYKLNKKGYLLIHGAGISKNGNGKIFCGRGSSFKTSLCMNFLHNRNFSYLGDERVILTPDGDCLSFFIHPKSFIFKVNHLSSEEFRRSKLHISGYLNFLRYLFFLRSETPDNFLGENFSKINSIFFLQRTNKQKIQKDKIDIDDAKRMFVLNNCAETIKSHTFFFFNYGNFFYRYTQAYSYIFPENELVYHWERFSKNLTKLLQTKHLFIIQIPFSYSDQITDYFINIWENE